MVDDEGTLFLSLSPLSVSLRFSLNPRLLRPLFLSIALVEALSLRLKSNIRLPSLTQIALKPRGEEWRHLTRGWLLICFVCSIWPSLFTVQFYYYLYQL